MYKIVKKNIIPVVPHEAVPEVSKGKVHITQNKNVPIGIDCDFLNTFHSISHAALSWRWPERRRKKNYSVLQSATKYQSLLLPSTKYHFGTTPYCNNSTTPVLFGTTKYYKVALSTTKNYSSSIQYYYVRQSTTPYYKVLLQYYKVLLCTTKYYSSTTKYYSSTTKYYSVLQSTTPVLQSTDPVLMCTTKYDSSTTKYYSSTNPYYKVLLQY